MNNTWCLAQASQSRPASFARRAPCALLDDVGKETFLDGTPLKDEGRNYEVVVRVHFVVAPRPAEYPVPKNADLTESGSARLVFMEVET
jgi:hypothetical protein